MKWGGAAVTVLLVVVWIGGGRYHVEYGWKTGEVQAACGGLEINTHTPNPRFQMSQGWGWGRINSDPFLWRSWDQEYPEFHNRFYPLWPAVSVAALLTAAVWLMDCVRRRRERGHLCRKCHYDRTGLAVGAVCPECGEGSVPS